MFFSPLLLPLFIFFSYLVLTVSSGVIPVRVTRSENHCNNHHSQIQANRSQQDCYLFDFNATLSFVLELETQPLIVSNVLPNTDSQQKQNQICFRIGAINFVGGGRGGHDEGNKQGFISRKKLSSPLECQQTELVPGDRKNEEVGEEALEGYIFLGESEAYKVYLTLPSKNKLVSSSNRRRVAAAAAVMDSKRKRNEKKKGRRRRNSSSSFWLYFELKDGLSFPELLFEQLPRKQQEKPRKEMFETRHHRERRSSSGSSSNASGLHIGLMIVTDDTMTEYYEQEDLVIHLMALVGDIQSVYRY